MRRTIISCLGLIIGLGTLPASSEGVLGFPFVGVLTMTTTSPECGGNILVDDIFPAIYRPLISPDTIPGALQLYKERQAVRMEDTKKGQFRGSGNYNGTLFDGRGRVQTFTGAYSDVIVSPKGITPGTTEFVTMKGTFTNFDGRVGCTVSIRASFNARAS
jgi:hypothetical protein